MIFSSGVNEPAVLMLSCIFNDLLSVSNYFIYMYIHPIAHACIYSMVVSFVFAVVRLQMENYFLSDRSNKTSGANPLCRRTGAISVRYSIQVYIYIYAHT